jgi:hypothetical protein
VQSNKSTNDVDVNEIYETFESDINTIFDFVFILEGTI